ncbi:hypothetical protein [Allosphingosinicella humi]
MSTHKDDPETEEALFISRFFGAFPTRPSKADLEFAQGFRGEAYGVYVMAQAREALGTIVFWQDAEPEKRARVLMRLGAA